MNISLEHLAKAFEAWENDFRINPSNYLTEEQCALAQVSEVSAARAAYFQELLNATT